MRKLTNDDYDSLLHMDTGIQDDYVVRIFPQLVSSNTQALYGLFEGDVMKTVAGYTIFADHFAMLGRLRSDRRFYSKGYATELLSYIIQDLRKLDNVQWIGAHTQIENKPARRVLDKLSISPVESTYHAAIDDWQHLGEIDPGTRWEEVTQLHEKKAWIQKLSETSFRIYPYEMYYPFPYVEQLLSDAYIESSAFYVNDDGTRYVMMKEDVKRVRRTHVKYLWDDLHEQRGLWRTIAYEAAKHPNNEAPWIDVLPTVYEALQDEHGMDFSEEWILYGDWKE
ncbi:GCN5 family acetyltransferase [Pontibacillus halophilus JSM 076056 = DSM 19796]|uniref:GCN5 family acetyltransferase n=1 Tax=Pontibacillus halophilus JSM 076056 = DSM 19796 TaxID=1385510 RepID=A0A0A5IAK6_9BACI|nr:GCN5 family acetyltransferase [Pontibacillus halophilus JSM 076056 = DSM 19796]